MKKVKQNREVKEHLLPPKKHGNASQGDSSRTQKGNPAEKGKGKQEGRK